MVDDAIKAGSPDVAMPATGQAGRYAEVLAELTEMALDLARAFQGAALAAVQGGGLDRAAVAEAGFNRTALGIRRAVALDARLRREREAALREAEDRRGRLRQEKDERRRAVAKGLCRAIAALRPGAAGAAEARERLTADLWARLSEDERIDADLADAALPIEALVLSLGRQLGLPRRALGAGLGPEEKASPARAAPKPWDEIPAAPVAPADAPAADLPMPPPLDWSRASYSYHRSIAAEDVGGPEGETWIIDTATGDIFDQDWTFIRTLPKDDRPPDDAGPPAEAGPPAAAGPPDPAPGQGPPEPPGPPAEAPAIDPAEAERRRRERERADAWRGAQLMAHIHRHG